MSGFGGQADIRAVPEDQSTDRVYAGIVVKTRARPRQRLGAGVRRREFIRLLSPNFLASRSMLTQPVNPNTPPAVEAYRAVPSHLSTGAQHPPNRAGEVRDRTR